MSVPVNGRSLKWFSLMDEYARGCLAMEVNRQMTLRGEIAMLADLLVMRGAQAHTRSDNGAEFIAQAMRATRSVAKA